MEGLRVSEFRDESVDRDQFESRLSRGLIRPVRAPQCPEGSSVATVVHERSGNRLRLGVVNGVFRFARMLADVVPIRVFTMKVVNAVLAAPVLLLSPSSVVRSGRVNRMRVDVVIHPSVRLPGRTVVHIHGGGFVFGSTRTHRLLAAQLSWACRARVVLFDYRLMPGNAIDSSISDCMAAYEWAETTYPDSPIVLSGDSAGGNLMLTVLSRLNSGGRRLPVAAVGMSAWLDPDYVPPRGAPRDSFFSLRFARRAADSAEPRSAILPLKGSLPTVPVLLQCGAEEPIRPGNAALADRLTAQGVPVELQVWAGQPHVFQMLAPFAPEAVAALVAIDDFLSPSRPTTAVRSCRDFRLRP